MFAEWSSPEAVFQILKRLSRGRPCDFSGIADYAALDQAGGIQWPFPEGATLTSHERRLYEDGTFFTPDGKARLLFDDPRPLPEPTSAAYPLTLLTGRGSSSQWHTQSRTGKSAVLRRLGAREDYVEISPDDARARGIASNDLVQVVSQRGRVTVRAFVTRSVRAGELFIPMHGPTINKLTFAAFDPHSRQPAYKACAVNLTRVGQVD
jgi:assimilatory nitrate reductase catalytic subunit